MNTRVAEGACSHLTKSEGKKETVSSLTAGILNDVQGDQAWPQQRIQQYRATRRRSRNKKNIVGSCWLKELDRFQTLRNNVQQRVQTDATCNTPQC